MADDNRINLSEDLDKIANDVLKDVKAATDEVKQRQEAIKLDGQRDSDKARSRKLSALIVGIAAVVIVLLAYVFAGPDSTNRQQADAASQSSGKVAITCPVTTPTATPRTGGAASRLPSRTSQSSNHPPSDDYEQRDSGM